MSVARDMIVVVMMMVMVMMNGCLEVMIYIEDVKTMFFNSLALTVEDAVREIDRFD